MSHTPPFTHPPKGICLLLLLGATGAVGTEVLRLGARSMALNSSLGGCASWVLSATRWCARR